MRAPACRRCGRCACARAHPGGNDELCSGRKRIHGVNENVRVERGSSTALEIMNVRDTIMVCEEEPIVGRGEERNLFD